MKKILIRTGTGEAFNAASKARRDADAIACAAGYAPFTFRGERTGEGSPAAAARIAADAISNWRRLIREAEEGSTVLIQYPHYPMKTAYLARRMIPGAKRKKKIRFVALIHDLDSLRGLHGRGAQYSDRELLPMFDILICHNEKMKAYLAGQGIPPERMIPLGFFDYLVPGGTEMPRHTRADGIAIAGNLDPEKSGYIAAMLRENGGGIPIHLYGKGLGETRLPEWAQAHGSVPPETLAGEIQGGFGLVWDGPETGTCAGAAGEYLRYNNPHKLSLYLAAGMPVLIWKEAAQAEEIRRRGIGITAGSIAEAAARIRAATEAEYADMAARARQAGERIRAGEYLAEALRKADSLLSAL